MASEQCEKDNQRTAWLEAKGFSVIRFSNEEVLNQTDNVLNTIKSTLKTCMEKDNQAKHNTGNLPQDSTPSLWEGRGRLLIFSAPSGSGKSTIVQWLIANHPELNLAFSISCTSRAPRRTERDGVEYFFLTPEAFKEKIRNDEFLEYEEVYQDRFYGTLKSQVDSQTARGENVIFDVDVKGGVNIKQFYGERALSIFIQPPSVEELRRRLVGRATDAPEVIEQRLAKADYELTFADRFDHVVVNDDLAKAEQETYEIIARFLGK